MITWKDVPSNLLDKWRKTFNSNREGICLSTACPVCGKKTLRKYYHTYVKREKIIDGIKFIGDGGLWCWCSSCGSYEHSSAAIPHWWQFNNIVDEEKLMHNPEPIDNAIKEMNIC